MTNIFLNLAFVFCGFLLGFIFCNSIWKKKMKTVNEVANDVLKTINDLIDDIEKAEKAEKEKGEIK